MSRALAVVAVLGAVSGCDDLVGLAPSELPPLGAITVQVTGDLGAVRDPDAPPSQLYVALRWLFPGVPDTSCLPPAENPAHARILDEACVDPLSVSPGFDGTIGVPVADDGIATIGLYSPPAQLYGDMYSQIAYATIVAYDVQAGLPDGFPGAGPYFAASFLSMSQPDVRLAFRHGGYNDELAYYPRRGCAPPPAGFSLVSASGFTVEQALEAQQIGELPSQDPAGCRVDSLDRGVQLALRPEDELRALRCFTGPTGFDDPPPALPSPGDPDEEREVLVACTTIPRHFEGSAEHPNKRQALVAVPVGSCTEIRHYVLRGCFGSPFCSEPQWSAAPPSWWPCPADAEP